MAAACVLAAAALQPAHALMLGAPQGDLLLGRALRLRVPVRMDPGYPLVADCIRVELRDGDTEVPAGALGLRVRTTAAAQGWIELQSSLPLHAPFVQLTVHMECQFAQTRRYTLLVQPGADAGAAQPLDGPGAAADVAPEGSAQIAPAPAPADAVRAAPDAAAIAAANATAPLAPESVRAPLAEPGRVAPASRRVARASHRRAAVVRHTARHARHERHAPRHHVAHAATPPGSASRLRLDWMSTSRVEPAGAGAIHAAGVAAAAPASAPRPHVASAAGARVDMPALAQTPSASPTTTPSPTPSPADIAQRLQIAQARLAQLQASVEANQRELAALRRQLEQERMQRQQASAPSWGRDLLLAVFAAAVSLLGLLWWQRRPTSPRTPRTPWYVGSRPAVAAPGGRESGRLDIAAREAAPAFAPSQPAGPPSRLDAASFQRPLSAPEQMQVDEVVDHGHLADFFIGLGDYDKAIEIMRRALGEPGAGTSVLPYLYLFDLYRRTGRRDEYEQLLGECGPRLNARIPRWDDDLTQAAPRDLLDYPRALALLVQAWPTPARTTVIERMIADDPQRPRVGFELPAYRDLLDLYALAAELQRSQAQEPAQDQVQMPMQTAAPDLSLSLQPPLA